MSIRRDFAIRHFTGYRHYKAYYKHLYYIVCDVNLLTLHDQSDHNTLWKFHLVKLNQSFYTGSLWVQHTKRSMYPILISNVSSKLGRKEQCKDIFHVVSYFIPLLLMFQYVGYLFYVILNQILCYKGPLKNLIEEKFEQIYEWS